MGPLHWQQLPLMALLWPITSLRATAYAYGWAHCITVTAPDGFALAHSFFGGAADTIGWAHALAFGTADGFALAQLYFCEVLPMCNDWAIGLAATASMVSIWPII